VNGNGDPIMHPSLTPKELAERFAIPKAPKDMKRYIKAVLSGDFPEYDERDPEMGAALVWILTVIVAIGLVVLLVAPHLNAFAQALTSYFCIDRIVRRPSAGGSPERLAGTASWYRCAGIWDRQWGAEAACAG